MTLEQYIITLLETQAKTLTRLAALLGSPAFLVILEESGDLQPVFSLEEAKVDLKWFSFKPKVVSQGFSAIPGAIQVLHLPPTLEFHLWCYPFYRALIESPLPLKATLSTTPHHQQRLVDLTVQAAQTWANNLLAPLHPNATMPLTAREQVMQVAFAPWLRFRTQMLKKMGHPPIKMLEPS